MNSINDFFFQIALFLLGAIVGVISQIFGSDHRRLRWLLLTLAILLVAISILWTRSEMTSPTSVNPSPVAQSTETATQTPEKAIGSSNPTTPENEDSIVVAVMVQACIETHHLPKQKEITIVTEVPYNNQEQRPGSLIQRRKIAYCQWPPSLYSDSDGYVEIITDEVKGPGLSEASGASYADRIYSRCDRLRLSYSFGKQFVSGHSSFEVSANSIVTVGGENWDPESMGENPSDYYYDGWPVLGFYTEDREVVVIHYAAFNLEDASCIP